MVKCIFHSGSTAETVFTYTIILYYYGLRSLSTNDWMQRNWLWLLQLHANAANKVILCHDKWNSDFEINIFVSCSVYILYYYIMQIELPLDFVWIRITSHLKFVFWNSWRTYLILHKDTFSRNIVSSIQENSNLPNMYQIFRIREILYNMQRFVLREMFSIKYNIIYI